MIFYTNNLFLLISLILLVLLLIFKKKVVKAIYLIQILELMADQKENNNKEK